MTEVEKSHMPEEELPDEGRGEEALEALLPAARPQAPHFSPRAPKDVVAGARPEDIKKGRYHIKPILFTQHQYNKIPVGCDGARILPPDHPAVKAWPIPVGPGWVILEFDKPNANGQKRFLACTKDLVIVK